MQSQTIGNLAKLSRNFSGLSVRLSTGDIVNTVVGSEREAEYCAIRFTNEEF
jgi:hypothetical protein